MAKFIPTLHKKFIVLISYSYKFRASRPGFFLTKVVNFNADKCQSNRLKGGKYSPQRAQRSQRHKKIYPQTRLRYSYAAARYAD